MKGWLLQLCIALISCIFFACKKQKVEQYRVSLNSQTPQTLSFNGLSPSIQADSVDLFADIVINYKKLGSHVIALKNFTLKNGKLPVPGNERSTDTNFVFEPESDLEPHTIYQASATLIVTGTGRDDRIVNGYGTNNLQTFLADTSHVSVSWSFKTRGGYIYSIRRTSTSVTDFSRDGNKVMQMGDYLYTYGGWSAVPHGSHNDIYRSGGDLTTWEKLPDAPWEGRHTHGIGKIDTNLYIFGGDHLSTVFDVWKTTDGLNFQQVQQDVNSVLGPRILYGSCVHNNKLYILGGQASLDNNMGKTDVWVSTRGTFWKKVATGLPFLGKNISGVVASFNNRIWVVGGGYYRDPDMSVRYTNEVYSSEDGIDWRREPDAPWLPRQYADVCVWNGRLWMIGGYNENNLSDIWYMTKDGTWHEYKPEGGFLERHASGVGVYNDQLVIVCGNYYNDAWVISKE